MSWRGRRVIVVTSEIRPPIPTRSHDWQATLDGYEPGDPIGHGPTEADAVCDLYIEIEAREDESREDEPDPDEARERQRDDALWFGEDE